ncbi:hypothetical protein FGL74_00060 [Leuconostoc koreense]|nr:hypothetical protein FGL74_00060 [Leuconostoc mesenteroides]QGM25718.1 hypothetical protein GJV51_06910 [Leuconostoc mesenteroides subsp. mesenteroides]
MNYKKINNVLIILIIMLSCLSGAYGIFSHNSINTGMIISTVHKESIELYGKGIYHNESLAMAMQARGQDIVTLLIAIPTLGISLFLQNRNSVKGRFLVTGSLGYFLYTYASYCFVAMYNSLFLVYIAIFSLSFFAFTLNFSSFHSEEIIYLFRDLKFRKMIGVSIILFSLLISLMWLGKIIPTTFSGVPSGLEHYTTLPIQAIDLAIIVPITIIGGVLFIKQKNLGYLLTTVIIIKDVTMLLAIDAMIIVMIIGSFKTSIIEVIIFPLFTLFYIFNLYLLIKSIKEVTV